MAIIKDKEHEELHKKYDEREKWFQDRIGKRVFRNKTSCKCDTCKVVYEKGLIINDRMHASYLHDVEGVGIVAKYFDTKEEATEFEKTVKNPSQKRRVSTKK